MVEGLASLDRRSVAVRALLDWRAELVSALGGEDTVTLQQTALVDLATRTRLYVDHLDAFLMAQRSLVNAKKKTVLPVLRERQQLADSLARLLTQLGLERRVRTLDLAQVLREARDDHEREANDGRQEPTSGPQRAQDATATTAGGAVPKRRHTIPPSRLAPPTPPITPQRALARRTRKAAHSCRHSRSGCACQRCSTTWRRTIGCAR
jgi:hypothetical protein